MNAAFQSLLNLGVTGRCLARERVFLEASSIPCCASLILAAVRHPGRHFTATDLSPALVELMERNLFLDMCRDYAVKCLLESLLIWLDSLGGETDRDLYCSNNCSVCQTSCLELLSDGPMVALPAATFPTDLVTLFDDWLALGGRRRCSGCNAALEKKYQLAGNNVLVFFLPRRTRIHPVTANQTMDVPAQSACGTERFCLSSVICQGPLSTQFYTYLMGEHKILKAENDHVFSADDLCSEDMNQTGVLYVYEKVRRHQLVTDVSSSPAPPLQGDQGAFGEEPNLTDLDYEEIPKDAISDHLEAGEI
ncbi:uncharacterized protein LOC129377538 [Poeciliopsis prolifica]|uniref:uncharacterized protein LOC129377538 n=1 Tax=Poeciliopsis prolifica TaxID=188132 RepID=UPI00241431FD|nr:uncharacterized protein LOC129377538 [Poeciliopsis prolifica]